MLFVEWLPFLSAGERARLNAVCRVTPLLVMWLSLVLCLTQRAVFQLSGKAFAPASSFMLRGNSELFKQLNETVTFLWWMPLVSKTGMKPPSPEFHASPQKSHRTRCYFTTTSVVFWLCCNVEMWAQAASPFQTELCELWVVSPQQSVLQVLVAESARRTLPAVWERRASTL